ncbi:MAG TPA: discoidin domain-containing protein [Candidatus Lumbricidophila sp.]|nr:discoidin domain-containing protein [Candidatus Lumbricidophila sp.]
MVSARATQRTLATVGALVLSAVTAVTAAGPVVAQPMAVSLGAAAVLTPTEEWAAESAILDAYKGVYDSTTPIRQSWNTQYAPDGPLMGNGTVLGFAAGDRKTQNIYLSRSDMWRDRDTNNGQQYTALGGLSIGVAGLVDLARGKTVTASGSVGAGEAPSMLTDGLDSTKWCSTTATSGSSTHWAVVDLGSAQAVARWVVKHAAYGGETSSFNTKNFKLQYATVSNPQGANNADWIDADTVTNNTAAITDRNLAASISTRYVRLLVTTPDQGTNGAVRIYGLELYANTATAAAAFRYEEDMKNAEVFARSETGFESNTFIAATENLMVTTLTNPTQSALPIEVKNWTANSNTTAQVQGNTMVATKAGVSVPTSRPSGTGTWGGFTVNVAVASTVVGASNLVVANVDSHTNKSTFTLQPGQTVTIVTAVDGGKQTASTNTQAQAIQQAIDHVNATTPAAATSAVRDAHRAWWKQYWQKSFIDIADPVAERFYYGEMYMLGAQTSTSSSGNAGLPTGLYPWTGADTPGWQGDFTTNTDMQRQVHPLVAANRLDGIDNYMRMLESYWPEAQRRSASVVDLNRVIQGTGGPSFTQGIPGGALVPTHIGPWGASTELSGTYKEYWNCPSDATAALMPVIKQWQYTRDDVFLRDRLYPLLRTVATFWEGYVKLENGKYVVYGATHEGVAGRNAILDLDAATYALRTVIAAANVLGVDAAKIPVWQNIVDNMSPQPTFTYNNKTVIGDVEGRTQTNPGPTFDGNPVTIQSVYYYDVLGMTAPAAAKEKYLNYISISTSTSARLLTSATRIGYDIGTIMTKLKQNASPLRGNNTSAVGFAPNLLGTIQDSLLQSNEGFLNVFANWYNDQAASFTRLRAAGGFLVTASQDATGNVTSLQVTSEKGIPLSILNPWPGQQAGVFLNGTQIASTTSTNSLGQLLNANTQAGATYEIKKLTAPPAPTFSSGLESGQTAPTWLNTVDTTGGGLKNVGGIAGTTAPELAIRTGEYAHTGSSALMYSGSANNMGTVVSDHYAYLKAFDLSASPIPVTTGTTLSYWVFPQSNATSSWVPAGSTESTCVAVDLIFNDGSNLRDSGAVDQTGDRAHAAYQCTKLTLDAWNLVTVDLGSKKAGKQVVRINFAYDHRGTNSGGYRGYFDDITIQ